MTNPTTQRTQTRPETLTVAYRRSATGTTIHRAECSRAGARSKPWKYADGFDWRDLLATINHYPWLRPCGVCRPTDPEFPASFPVVDEPGVKT